MLPITCSALICLTDYLCIYKNKMCVHSDNEEGHLKLGAKYSLSLTLTQIIYHRQKYYILIFIFESVYLLMILGKCIVLSYSGVSELFAPPMNYSLLGYSVHGIFQARILNWVAITFSRDIPDPEIKPTYPESPALAGGCFTAEQLGSLRKEHIYC